MLALFREHQLNILLSLSSICGVTAFFTVLTGKWNRKRCALFLLELSAALLLAAGRLAYLYAGDTSAAGYWKVRVYNFLDYSMVLAVIFTFTLYLKEMFRDRGLDPNLKRFRLVDLLLGLGELLIVASQFTGFYYFIDETNHYHRGPGNALCFILPMTAILLLISLVIQHYRRLSKNMRLSLLLFPVIPLAASFIQLFIYGVEASKIAIASAAVLLYIFDLIDIKRTAGMSERAIAASEAKTEFLAQMSHEIRTPINAVLGMNEMILRESQRGRDLSADSGQAVLSAFENIAACAGDVERAGNNLLAIINDILDFSKIEAGRLDLTEAPYHLSSLLNDACNTVYYKAKEKGLKFEVDADKTLPDGLVGDELRVRQILTNILSNAVKYTERGSIRLTLRGDIEDTGTLLLKAAVADTGVGIRPEDLDRLFTRFERLDLPRNSSVEGTGLGLVITKRLLDRMDGSIAVQSEYGKGSVFTVTIPQEIFSLEPMGDFRQRFAEISSEAGPYRESFRAPDARALIVDDTKINLTVAAGLLKNTLLRIDTAGSGAEAVSLARKRAYDVILMDQRMPGMDGTEALRRIRAGGDGPNRETPIICLTADAVIGAKERYLAEGFSDYLTKPIDSRALEKMLIRYLPEEKLTVITEAAPISSADEEDGVFEALRGAGIDPQLGLHYAQDDRDFYCSLLSDYAREARNRADKLSQFYHAEDWNNYAILVHAVKSSSRAIGAAKLSDTAARLEAAANAGDVETIRREHDALTAQYLAAADGILAALPENAADAESQELVLEFEPAPGEAMGE